MASLKRLQGVATSLLVALWASLLLPSVQELLAAHPVPGWSLVVLSAVFLVVGPALRPQRSTKPAAPKRSPKPRERRKPSYTDYTSDKIDGAMWRWLWNDGRINNLWAACPICDSELVAHQDYFAGHMLLCCERCRPNLGLPVNEPGGPFSSLGLEDNPMKVVTKIRGVDTIKREIRRRLRTGERPLVEG